MHSSEVVDNKLFCFSFYLTLARDFPLHDADHRHLERKSDEFQLKEVVPVPWEGEHGGNTLDDHRVTHALQEGQRVLVLGDARGGV